MISSHDQLCVPGQRDEDRHGASPTLDLQQLLSEQVFWTFPVTVSGKLSTFALIKIAPIREVAS